MTNLQNSSSRSIRVAIAQHFTVYHDKALSLATNIKVNVVCPGFVATDLNNFRGYRTVEQGAKQAVKMALIGPEGPTGTFTDEDGTVPW